MKEKIISFIATDLDHCSVFLEQYKKQISIPYDDFLEAYILASEFYFIEINGQRCGFFGINEKLLTILFIDELHFSYGSRLFAEIKSRYPIQEAFVPTTDIAALSILLENYKEIKIQALHFSDTDRTIRPAEFGKEYFRRAEMADLAEIQKIAGDFLDDYGAKITAKELYVLEKEDEILGIGVLEKNRIMNNCIGTGMLTKESQRGRGVGRSMILHLKTIVYDMSMAPVPGCWYYNTNSRKTLESAGYITKSKLLRVIL
jgi:hypothetical protein